VSGSYAGITELNSVSCATAGNCAGGCYDAASGKVQAFVVSQT
jgi:hypothetical protein